MANVPKSQYDDLQKRHKNMRKSREREQRRCSKLEVENELLREELKKLEKLANDVERCYRMLLSEQDTKGALFKAENILREALAEHKVGAGGTATVMPNAKCG